MPNTDPHRRAAHLGCGAALYNLRVAAAHAGWTPVAELLPEPGDPALLAAVRLEDAGPPEDGPPDLAALAALHAQIGRRRTGPGPFDDREIPPELRAELADAAHVEGVALVFPDPRHTGALFDPVRDEGAPTPALLGTAADRPADRLRAGQAMEHVLLLAARRGLAASLTPRAPGWPEPRALLRDPRSDMAHVQMVMRLGYARRRGRRARHRSTR